MDRVDGRDEVMVAVELAEHFHRVDVGGGLGEI